MKRYKRAYNLGFDRLQAPYQARVDFESKTRKELVTYAKELRTKINTQKGMYILQIRHFRRIMLKVRNELDYLLKHPYSNGTGIQSRVKVTNKWVGV